jgi:hypothetical protein
MVLVFPSITCPETLPAPFCALLAIEKVRMAVNKIKNFLILNGLIELSTCC